MVEFLSAIDWVIAGVAVITILLPVVRVLRGESSAESLAQAPERTNLLREDLLAFAMLAYVAAAAILSMLVHPQSEDGEGPWVGLVVGGGSQLIGLAACLYIVSGYFQGGINRFFWGRLRAPGRPPARTDTPVRVIIQCTVVAIGLCTLVLSATERILSVLMPEYECSAHPTIEMLNEHKQPLGVILGLWIGAAGLAPLAEEVFFRGLVQTYLVGLLGSRWRAIGLTSIAFASVHWSQPHAIPALILLAAVMGYAYERTGALAAPFAIHALFNLKSLVWSALEGPIH